MQLERLEVGEADEDLLTHGLEIVVVDVDGLYAVAEVVEGVPVDLDQGVVREVDGFLLK